MQASLTKWTHSPFALPVSASSVCNAFSQMPEVRKYTTFTWPPPCCRCLFLLLSSQSASWHFSSGGTACSLVDKELHLRAVVSVIQRNICDRQTSGTRCSLSLKVHLHRRRRHATFLFVFQPFPCCTGMSYFADTIATTWSMCCTSSFDMNKSWEELLSISCNVRGSILDHAFWEYKWSRFRTSGVPVQRYLWQECSQWCARNAVASSSVSWPIVSIPGAARATLSYHIKWQSHKISSELLHPWKLITRTMSSGKRDPQNAY